MLSFDPNQEAISILIFVANDAVATLTKLFQISIVIKSLSEFVLNFFKCFAQGFLCLIKESIL